MDDKGFPPALYYKANTRYIQLAGAAAQKSSKEKQEEKREINADTGRSTKKGRPATAAPSEEVPPRSQHPEVPRPSNTLKRECDDAAAVARTSSRVSPGTRGIVGKGYTRCPSGRSDGARRRHRIGAGQADRDFSRSTTTTTTSGISKCTTSSATHQLVPPRLPNNPPRFTGAVNTRLGEEEETPATGATTTRPEGGDSLHRHSRADRTRRRGLARPRWPGRAHMDPDSPVTTLQHAGQRSPHRPRPPPPRHHQGTSPPSTKPPARPNPDGPKWAQI